MSQVRQSTTAVPRQPQSRPTAEQVVHHSQSDRFQRRVIDRDELGNTPTILTKEQMVCFCNDVLGVPISPTRMRRGVERRELVVWKIGGVNATSPQALYDWIQGMARPVVSQDGAES